VSLRKLVPSRNVSTHLTFCRGPLDWNGLEHSGQPPEVNLLYRACARELSTHFSAVPISFPESSFRLTSGQKTRNSGRDSHFEITKERTEFCPSGLTAQSASVAHAWNGQSQSLSFSDHWSKGTKSLGTRLLPSSPQCILLPMASVSFGHVVGETEGSGNSHYRISVNQGHPVAHA